MSTYNLIISKDGYDISTIDPRNLIFHSELDTAAVALQGTSQQTGNSGNTLTFTITHGLGFIPFALVYLKTSYYPNNWKWCPFFAASWAADFLGNKDTVYNTNIRIDGTNLVVRVILGNGSSDKVTIKYYLFNVAM